MVASSSMSTPTPKLYDAVAAIAQQSQHHTDDATLYFTRFRHAKDETGGTSRTSTWEAWAWSRVLAAKTPAPCADKRGYPAEIGAMLDGRGKKAENVQMVTWLLLDADKGDDFEAMESCLRRLGLAFLIVESSSSQQEGNPVKWHCYLPIVPVSMPSRATEGIDWPRTVDATEEWWRQLHAYLRHVFGMLGASERTGGAHGSITFPGVRFDAATDKLAQQTFVSHRPFLKGPEDDRYASWSGGRILDVVALAAQLGKLAEGVCVTARPDCVLSPAASQEGGRQGAAPKVASAAPQDVLDATQDAPTGPTPNQTTGTLVYQALDHFGLVGRRHDDVSYLTLCPWRDYHTSAVRANSQDKLTDSVLVYVRGGKAGEDGGFECKHEGRGVLGECSQASAADVLRWARRRGAAIPNRPEWGSEDPLPIPPSVQPDGSVAEVVAEFATAPEVTEARADDVASVVQADTQDAPTDKPRIEITNNLVEMARAALNAVAAHNKIFTRGGVLVDLIEEGDKIVDRYGMRRRPRIRTTTKPFLHALMSDCAEWYTVAMTKKGGIVENPTRPDKDVVAAMLAAGTFGRVRRLEDVVYTPVFRKDGSLLDRDGYDAATGLLLRDEVHVPSVPRDPTRAELLAARTRLLDLLVNFPFRDGTAALCYGVWLSAVFAPFLRYCYSGSKPLIAISANRAGGGTTKLVNVATLISEGRPAAMSGKMLGDDGELERILGMHVEACTPALCIDNIPIGVRLASSALESFITTPDYTTRKIGTSSRIKATYFDGLLWATGNMLETGGDMSRRVLRIDIEDRTKNPAERQVKEPDLELYVKGARQKLVHDVLTLLCGFFAAKARGHVPSLPAGGFGSFEGWSDYARRAVVWCGLPDPVYARGKVAEDSVASFGFLVEHLRQCYPDGNRVGNIAAALVKNRSAAKRDEALANLDGHLDDETVVLSGQRGDSSKLGRHVSRFNGLVHVDGEGRRWQLNVSKRSNGSFVVVTEAK